MNSRDKFINPEPSDYDDSLDLILQAEHDERQRLKNKQFNTGNKKFFENVPNWNPSYQQYLSKQKRECPVIGEHGTLGTSADNNRARSALSCLDNFTQTHFHVRKSYCEVISCSYNPNRIY